MYAVGEHVWSITRMMWMMAIALAMSLTMAWAEIRNKKTMVCMWSHHVEGRTIVFLLK